MSGEKIFSSMFCNNQQTYDECFNYCINEVAKLDASYLSMLIIGLLMIVQVKYSYLLVRFVKDSVKLEKISYIIFDMGILICLVYVLIKMFNWGI